MINLTYSKVHKININMTSAHNSGLTDDQIEKCCKKVSGVIGARNTRVFSNYEISIESAYFKDGYLLEMLVEQIENNLNQEIRK